MSVTVTADSPETVVHKFSGGVVKSQLDVCRTPSPGGPIPVPYPNVAMSLGAGECETDGDGKIKRADNFSGHYQPNEKNLKKTKENFESQGLAAADAKFEVYDKSQNLLKGL